MRYVILFLTVFICAGAGYETKNSPNFPQNRSSISRPFGNGTLTNRSDGSSNFTRPLSQNATITTERNSGGKTTTGMTSKFGNGTITRWSDGRTTTSRPLGNSTIITETDRSGNRINGFTRPLGNGSQTNWSNGSSNSNRNLGKGSVNYDRK